MTLLSHFKGVKLSPKGIHFSKTGVDIAWDIAFFKSAIGVVRMNIGVIYARLKNALSAQHNGTIAFYPDMPGPWYNARAVAHIAGLKITSDVNAADRIFIFDDKTHSQPVKGIDTSIAINHQILDISKTHVGEVFERIFGYSISIDPLSYSGKAVQKSDANATHDGAVVECPLAADQVLEGCVYQKLIESTFNERQSEDLRIAYVRGDIPVVFHKYKNLDVRFGTDYARVDVLEAEDMFSPDEIKTLIAFCGAMGLDFGAVDVMRDKNDGRIYVVDVNKTCMPVLCLSLGEQMKALRKISNSFLRIIRS